MAQILNEQAVLSWKTLDAQFDAPLKAHFIRAHGEVDGPKVLGAMLAWMLETNKPDESELDTPGAQPTRPSSWAKDISLMR